MILVGPFQPSIFYGSMILLDFLEKRDEKVLLSLILSKRNHVSKIYSC